MIIAVVGNGFDLRQGFKTGFDHFLDHFNENYSSSNLLYLYFHYTKASKGWLDFEMHLQQFLVCYSEFVSLPTFKETDERYKITTDGYIKSHDHYIFCDIIPLSFGFLSRTPDLRAIFSATSDWRIILDEKINRDIFEIKHALKNYLISIEQSNLAAFEPSESPEIKILKLADQIITFNYTRFLENIAPIDKIKYAHGKLTDDFVLGIPFTPAITQQSLNIHFKTSQSIFNNYLSPIIQNIVTTHIVFIGFSFGKSDHYFFQDVLNSIKDFEKYSASIRFYSFYFDSTAKYQIISNFRDFFGEDEFVRLFSAKRIRFHSYESEFDFSLFI